MVVTVPSNTHGEIIGVAGVNVAQPAADVPYTLKPVADESVSVQFSVTVEACAIVAIASNARVRIALFMLFPFSV
jgi:hypothetical protein